MVVRWTRVNNISRIPNLTSVVHVRIHHSHTMYDSSSDEEEFVMLSMLEASEEEKREKRFWIRTA